MCKIKYKQVLKLILTTVSLFSCNHNKEDSFIHELNLPKDKSFFVREIDSLGVRIYMLDSVVVFSDLEGKLKPYVRMESFEPLISIKDTSVKNNADYFYLPAYKLESPILIKKSIYRSLNEKMYPSFYFESDTVVKCKKHELLDIPILELRCDY